MGLTLIWGTLKIFNYAHGSFITIGAYLTWALVYLLGCDFWISIIIAFFLFLFLGIVLEKTVMGPLLGQGLMPVIIGTLSVSIFVENVILETFGPRIKRLPAISNDVIRFSFITVSVNEVIISILSLSVLIVMGFLLKKTKLGLAMRAVAQDEDAARLMGIKVSNIYLITVALASALAGIAGIFIGARELMTPTLGNWPLLKAFIIVVFGGLGSVKGTILASFIVAQVEVFTALYLGIYWIGPTLFIFMMVGLILKPEGLCGKKR